MLAALGKISDKEYKEQRNAVVPGREGILITQLPSTWIVGFFLS